MKLEYILQVRFRVQISTIFTALPKACPRVSYLQPDLFKEYADCVGIPLRSVTLKVLSNDGKPVKTNEIGVLWIKGANVMAGYYNNPEKTAEVLQDGWLCTGIWRLLIRRDF